MEDDKVLQQHPIMRNCFLIQKQFSDALNSTVDTNILEADIKILSLSILNHIFDLRDNFVLNNFINWFNQFREEQASKDVDFKLSFLKTTLFDKLKVDVDSIFPNVLKTGHLKYDESIEKSNDRFANKFGDVNILDFDYLVKNPPSKDLILHGTQKGSQRQITVFAVLAWIPLHLRNHRKFRAPEQLIGADIEVLQPTIQPARQPQESSLSPDLRSPCSSRKTKSKFSTTSLI